VGNITLKINLSKAIPLQSWTGLFCRITSAEKSKWTETETFARKGWFWGMRLLV